MTIKKSLFRFMLCMISVLLFHQNGDAVLRQAFANEHDTAQIIQATSSEQFYQLVSDLIHETKDGLTDENQKKSPGADRLIVSAKGHLDLRNLNGVLQAVADTEDHYVIQFSSEEAALEAQKKLNKNSDVRYVETDQLMYLPEKTDPMVSTTATSSHLSWGPEYIGTDQYSSYVADQAEGSLIVGIVDTGVATSHPFLKQHITAGYDFVENDTKPEDDEGHGSHVAGIVVDNIGSANIQIMPLRAMDQSGEGYVSDIANAIRYGVDHKASVINLSLGGDHSGYLEDAIQYAKKHGVICVVAAGNEGCRIDNHSCPGHIQDAITVGSIRENGMRSDFSNYGAELDLVAPGEDIYSCYLDYDYVYASGTSMATPHITACVALIRLLHPEYDQSILEEIFMRISDKHENPSDYFGYGCPEMARLTGNNPACNHYLLFHDEVASTCQKYGTKSYYSCILCDRLFSDRNATTPVTKESLTLDKTGHTSGTLKVIQKGGWGKEGLAVDTCTVCGQTLSDQQVLPALILPELEETAFTYTGSACKPKVVIQTEDGNILSKSYYKLTYSDNVSAGEAKVKVVLKNGYQGDAELVYTIAKASLKQASLSPKTYYYKGSWPSVTLRYNDIKLKKGQDYSITSKKILDNKKISLKIKGIGNFKGTRTLQYTLKLVVPEILSYKWKKNNIYVTWKSNQKYHDGYQVRYAYNKSMKNSKKMNISADQSSTVLKDADSQRIIYVQIRGCKKINGVMYYSDWSEADILEP